jgi:hypothetical protein
LDSVLVDCGLGRISNLQSSLREAVEMILSMTTAMKVRLVINREHVKIIVLTKHAYRSWALNYSDGLQLLPDGRFKTLWCRPYFSRVHDRS